MKKALAMGLGALMAAGSAAPLQAASQIDFSGFYRTYFITETNLGRQTGGPGFTDSYLGHRLEFNIDFKPTDELSIHTRLRTPDFRRWGSGNSTANTGSGFQTRHVYGRITQDWGQVLVGRLDEDLDNFGLASLGWIPENNPVFTIVSPFDNGLPVDAARYTNQWDNGFSILTQYAKLSNNVDDEAEGQGLPNGGNANLASDQDYDSFRVEAAYQWAGGGAALGAIYERNATLDRTGVGSDAAWYLNPAIRHGWDNGFSINLEAMLGRGAYDNAVPLGGNRFEDRDAEGYGVYLDFDYNYGPGNVNLAGWYASGTDFDSDKDKSLVEMGGNFIPLLVAYNDNAVGWGRNGTVGSNNNAVSVANNAVVNFLDPALASAGVGLYTDAVWGDGTAAYSAYVERGGGFLNWMGVDINTTALSGNNYLHAPTVDLLVNPEHAVEGDGTNHNAAMVSRQRTVSFNNDTEANHWAIALSGNHAFTDDIAMHYALAYLGLNKPNYRAAGSALWNTASGTNQYRFTNYSYIEQDKDLGWEIDLGFSFQLLDNLQFTTALGYMFNGDAFKTLKGYTLSETANASGQHAVNAVWEDADDTYTWLNTLTFSF